MMMTKEDYYAQIKDMYAQMYESKLPKWQKTREAYYAQIEDIYAQMYGDSHAPRLLYRSKKENPEDQALDDEELVETEVATDPIETEHGTVSLVPEAQEENPNLENHEGWEQIVILEEESIPQSKVPIANSKILKSIEPGKVDLGLENLEYAVLNENLEQEWDQQNVNKKIDVDGDVKRDQKMISDAKTFCAHKMFVKMPSKVKRIKHLKGWKFKFKPTSKRSKLMDDMFSLVEETALLKKDPKETIWDGVKKEFKETMAAYGKTRVDQFKLVEEKASRVVHDKEMAVVRQRATSLMICDCSNRSSRANRVWKPGGLLCVQDHSGGSILMRTQRFHGLHLQTIIYMDMKFQEVIVVNVETGSKGLAKDGCVILGMNFAGFERGEAELVAISQKMQRIDLFSFCCSCTNQIFVAIHTEIEENLEFNQLLAAVERFSREVIEELAKRIVIEQKIEGGLICSDVKFHLKHKWRFRLFQSFSRLVLLALINPWLSKTHAFSGQLQDLRRGEAESFILLNFAAEPPFLWMENKSEPVLTSSAFERRKKKLCSKTWMFKYKVPHLDEKIFETSDQCIRKRGLVSADQETEDNQLILRSFMWVIQNCLDQYMVLLIASVAYDAQFSVGVGMNKKQLRLSLRNNRVWDPGGSLVDAATPCLLSLHFTALHFIAAILSFLKNLEVKVSLKEGDLIQEMRMR